MVLWYELNKKVLGHFVVFSNTALCERKPTWRCYVVLWYELNNRLLCGIVVCGIVVCGIVLCGIVV